MEGWMGCCPFSVTQRLTLIHLNVCLHALHAEAQRVMCSSPSHSLMFTADTLRTKSLSANQIRYDSSA